MSRTKDAQFTEEEAKKRFEAALRGAQIAGHKEMKDITKKSTTSRTKKRAHKGRKI